MLMVNPDQALEVLRALHALGVQLAIDDYGAGYSSLSYLRRLPVDQLKLDKAFVIHMNDDTRSEAIVRSTIDLAHSLDMTIVAEGVENEEVLRKLAASGCDHLQGYHISRPQPAARMTPWLRNRLNAPTPMTASSSGPIPPDR